MLLLSEWEAEAARKVYGAIVASTDGQARLLPILRPYDHLGSTRYVDFNTTKPVYPAGKSHLNWLVMDSDWEAKVGQVLDELPEVKAWVKNQGLGLRIPYTFEGEAAHYLPDLLVHIDDGGQDRLNLLIEVTGERKKDKAAKVATARDFWVPAINNDGRFGRWSFLEVTDPWDAGNLIRANLRGGVRH
jgi:type III restriction enzyme